MTARGHAVTASELLVRVEETMAAARAWTDDERIQRTASGAVRQLNEDMAWMVELSTAHANVALALAATEALVPYAPPEEGASV